MCVIYACHEKLPADSELEAGAFRNDDGAGIAWLSKEKGKVAWAKGLNSDVDEVKKYIVDNNIQLPYAIHFRNASIGGVDEALTHPFPITQAVETWTEGSANSLLMHNGHVHDWDKHFLHMLYNTDALCPEGKWSDSRALAFMVAMKGEGILNFVGGHYGRVLVFRGTPYPGREKKAKDRFFRCFGDWKNLDTAAKDGYYQSITVDNYNRQVSSSKGSATTAKGGTERSSKSTSGVWEHGSSRSGGKLLSDGSRPENSWTIDELETIVKALEEEQDNARRLVGG